MPTYRQSEPKAHGELLTPGNYDVEITDAVLKYAKSGNEMIKIEALIRQRGGDATLFDNLVFTEKAWWKIDRVLASLGFAIKPGHDIDVNPRMLVGRRGRVKVVNVAGDKPGVVFAEIDSWLLPNENPIPQESPREREPARSSVASRIPAHNAPSLLPDDDEDCIPF